MQALHHNAMPGFVSYVLAFLLVCLIFLAIFAWNRRRTSTMTASTNRLLFAIVILLFAGVFKLISSGLDIVVLVIALVGLGVGWYGISSKPH